VDLTRDGNERAFEAIVQRYRRPLLRYCSRLLPPTRAEDAVQQTFMSAHRAIDAGDAELNLRPWLYRIAHNATLNLLRQQGFDHEQVSEEVDGVETPPEAFERGERLRTVVAAVRQLPERQRSAVVLQAMEGRSYDEIAAELGVTDGAVRQLLNRARNTLREAAAAITPAGFLTRLGSTGAGDGSIAERVTQVVAGAGGGAVVAKAGATLLVAGAVAGGAVTGTLPGTGHPAQARGASAGDVVASPGHGSSAAGAHLVGVVLTNRGGSGVSVRVLDGRQVGGGPGTRQGGPSGSRGNSGGHDGPSGDGGSPGSSGGDHSGSGDSGPPGTSGDGGGSSGPSGSSSPVESDHSGHGHGSSSPDDSGPSPSGSPDSTPAAVVPVTPTSDSSGSGHPGGGKGSSPEPDEPPEPDKSGHG
jgi:RNA polymerase sigma factor (sigma-70 family)